VIELQYDSVGEERLVAFQRARQGMVNAYREWLVTKPDQILAAAECDFTDRLMVRERERANLRGLPTKLPGGD
jgi:hypothetical protein